MKSFKEYTSLKENLQGFDDGRYDQEYDIGHEFGRKLDSQPQMQRPQQKANPQQIIAAALKIVHDHEGEIEPPVVHALNAVLNGDLSGI